jgi:hypothetical protein
MLQPASPVNDEAGRGTTEEAPTSPVTRGGGPAGREEGRRGCQAKLSKVVVEQE